MCRANTFNPTITVAKRIKCSHWLLPILGIKLDIIVSQSNVCIRQSPKRKQVRHTRSGQCEVRYICFVFVLVKGPNYNGADECRRTVRHSTGTWRRQQQSHSQSWAPRKRPPRSPWNLEEDICGEQHVEPRSDPLGR